MCYREDDPGTNLNIAKFYLFLFVRQILLTVVELPQIATNRTDFAVDKRILESTVGCSFDLTINDNQEKNSVPKITQNDDKLLMIITKAIVKWTHNATIL